MVGGGRRVLHLGAVAGTLASVLLVLAMGFQGLIASAEEAIEPSFRNGHDLAYDTESDRVVLFGGFDGTAALADTWVYDFDNNTWERMTPLAAPPARRLHAMVYDAVSDLIVLFGGFDETNDLGDTWVYDFNTDTWSERNPSSAPSPRRAHKMGYDAGSARVVLHGGIGDASAIWSYDVANDTWTDLTVASGPSVFDHGLVYNERCGCIILFGGVQDGVTKDETWVFDLNSNMWTNVDPQTRPPALSHFAMSYDSQSDRVILFGGVGSDQTWVFDLSGNTWTNTAPSPHPSTRLGHRMAYDSESDVTVLFGGVSSFGGTRNNETWAYDYDTNTWTLMGGITGPVGLPPWVIPVLVGAVAAVAAALGVIIWRRKGGRQAPPPPT